jgi:hypothetical protein
VKTPQGTTTIHSGKLLWAAPPTIQNLSPVDLDGLEASAFNQLCAKEYSTGIVKITGLPVGLSLVNVAASTPYNLPPLPPRLAHLAQRLMDSVALGLRIGDASHALVALTVTIRLIVLDGAVDFHAQVSSLAIGRSDRSHCAHPQCDLYPV